MNDVYYIDNPGDVIVEEEGGGNDIVTFVGSQSPTPILNVETTTSGNLPPPSGGSTDNGSAGNGGAGLGSNGSTGTETTAAGTSVNEVLVGTKAKDALDGKDGDYKIYGRQNSDRLTGGTGKDAFVFVTKLDRKTVDKITDYDLKLDVIQIENKYFKGLKHGVLKKTSVVPRKAAAGRPSLLV